MSDDLITALEKSRLFAGFGKEQLDEAVTRMQPRLLTLKRGERLYQRGDKADRCWIIHSGGLTVQRASLRSPFCHMLYNRGSVTGIQGLADPDSKRVVSMIADEDTVLVEITRDGADRLDPATQIKLWQNVAWVLLHKLGACLERASREC